MMRRCTPTLQIGNPKESRDSDRGFPCKVQHGHLVEALQRGRVVTGDLLQR